MLNYKNMPGWGGTCTSEQGFAAAAQVAATAWIQSLTWKLPYAMGAAIKFKKKKKKRKKRKKKEKEKWFQMIL